MLTPKFKTLFLPSWTQPKTDTALNILFVCSANLCRSPLAEGLLRHQLSQLNRQHRIGIDSAGIRPLRIGQRPDPRSQASAQQLGFTIAKQRSRQIQANDYQRFDYLIAMDHGHYRRLLKQCPVQYQPRIHAIMDFAHQHQETELPDPYYGNQQGFQRVATMLEDAINGLINHLFSQHSDAFLPPSC